uniref:Uncharacterized protein n=1 Tax=Romanomermis culicivorax TaxID=13658 RepID=A0A915I323_ROMCU
MQSTLSFKLLHYRQNYSAFWPNCARKLMMHQLRRIENLLWLAVFGSLNILLEHHCKVSVMKSKPSF